MGEASWEEGTENQEKLTREKMVERQSGGQRVAKASESWTLACRYTMGVGSFERFERRHRILFVCYKDNSDGSL